MQRAWNFEGAETSRLDRPQLATGTEFNHPESSKSKVELGEIWTQNVMVCEIQLSIPFRELPRGAKRREEKQGQTRCKDQTFRSTEVCNWYFIIRARKDEKRSQPQ